MAISVERVVEKRQCGAGIGQGREALASVADGYGVHDVHCRQWQETWLEVGRPC
jgi:hypothetical protein